MSQASGQKLLIVDDELQIRRLLRLTLASAGYALYESETGQSGLQEAAFTHPDGVILDLGLPDMDGIEVLRRLREWSQTPVLVLSVRSGEREKIEALDTGADDYLTKPFSGGELLARVRAIMRRTQPNAESSLVSFGDIEIDLASRIVRRKGVVLHLTAKEYALFRLLVQHRGKVVTHQQILREVWGPAGDNNTHYLRVHMTHLRQKLEEHPQSPKHLLTDAGIGYRLVE
ncbi:MAG: response regulator [Opitutaceae bacterium]|nr:response regulator [Opitutaceae bacterium]